MRPKKRILLIDSNEDRMSLRRFLLETHGFAVLSAGTADESRKIFDTPYPELVMLCWPWAFAGGDAGALLDWMRQVNPNVPTMLVAENLTVYPADINVGAVLLKGSCSSAEIIERVKVMSARKRGPRKGVARIDRMIALAAGRVA